MQRDELKFPAAGRPNADAHTGADEEKPPSYRQPPKDPDTKLEPEDELSAAKRSLLDAAGCIDPFKAMRDKPYTTVGIAALVGVVLGWGTGTKAGQNVAGTVSGTVGGAAKALGVALKHLAPLVTTVTNLVMAKTAQKQGEEMTQHAGQAAQHPAAAGGSPGGANVAPPHS